MTLLSRTSSLSTLALVAGVAALIAAPLTSYAQAQMPPQQPAKPPKPRYTDEKGTLFFETKVGSFKILPRGEVFPSGTLTMSFAGSVLISDLDGTVTPSGNVRREYRNVEKGKQVWFGNGKLVISGKLKNVQWFGRDLKASYNGFGFVRLYGEFDKDLNTGNFWFASNPKKRYWGNHGTGVAVPEQNFQPGGGAEPIRRGDVKKPGG